MRKKVKVMLVVIAIVSAVALAGCGTDLSGSKFCGKWEAATAGMGKIKLDVKEVFKDGFTLEFQADGSCVLDVSGESKTGTWEEVDGKAIIDGEEEMPVTEENGKLILEYSGIEVQFEKAE